MENIEIAAIFEQVAELLEMRGENPFRIRAYRTAARGIRDFPGSVAALAKSGAEEAPHLPGVGKDLFEKIQVIVRTGQLPLLEELRAGIPPALLELLHVPGLGPKRALALHKRLGVCSLEELKAALGEGRVRKLKGFGEKSEEHLLKSVQSLAQVSRRMLLAEAKVFADALVRHLRQAPRIGQVEVAGSFRRRQETVGDLDILACCAAPKAAMDRFAAFGSVAEILARGATRMGVRLNNGLQVDLRIVPEKCFGAALQYFTGSKAHSIALRRRAQERGLKLNEYGIFRGAKQIGGRTEEEVYAAVGLPWIPPELREDRGEIKLAEEGRLPHLVSLKDIRGDLHMHTDLTDGRAPLEAMAAAAQARGYAYIALTDHSKRVTMAHGLDAAGLRRAWRHIDRLAAKTTGLALLKGVEVDILENGRLDLPDDVLEEADWVVASLHYGQKQPREQITQRLLNAVCHPCVSVLGHPSGRLIGRRQPYDFDLEKVLSAAAEHGCRVELNCQPDRLDLDDIALLAAKRHGLQITIGSDAHSTEELGFMEFGVYQARRAGLEAADILNTRELEEFRKLTARKKHATV